MNQSIICKGGPVLEFLLALLYIALIFMLIGAFVALYTDELLSAVIALGAIGFGSSGIFLLLRAPDLAITQVVVEVITLVLLIRATMVIGAHTAGGKKQLLPYLVAGGIVGGLFIFSVFTLQNMPEIGSSVMDRIDDAPSLYYLLQGLDLTGSTNQVMSVLLDFRAYDTLGEATVIFTAVLGGLTLLRKNGRAEPNE